MAGNRVSPGSVIAGFRANDAGKAKSTRRTQDDLTPDVLGPNDLTAEDIGWPSRRLRIGDEVRIRVVESDKASRPARRERSDPTLVENAEKSGSARKVPRLARFDASMKILEPD